MAIDTRTISAFKMRCWVAKCPRLISARVDGCFSPIFSLTMLYPLSYIVVDSTSLSNKLLFINCFLPT